MNERIVIASLLAGSLFGQEKLSVESLNAIHDPNDIYKSVYDPVPRTVTMPGDLVMPDYNRPEPALPPQKPEQKVPQVPPVPRREIPKTTYRAPSSSYDSIIAEMKQFGITTTRYDLQDAVQRVVSEHWTDTGRLDVINTMLNRSLYELCGGGQGEFSIANKGFMNPGAVFQKPGALQKTHPLPPHNEQIKIARVIADRYIEAVTANFASDVMNTRIEHAVRFDSYPQNETWDALIGGKWFGQFWNLDFIIRKEGHNFYAYDENPDFGACQPKNLLEIIKID